MAPSVSKARVIDTYLNERNVEYMRTMSKMLCSSAVALVAVCGLARTASASGTDYIVFLLDQTGSMSTNVTGGTGSTPCSPNGSQCNDGNGSLCTGGFCPDTRWVWAKNQAVAALKSNSVIAPDSINNKAFAILTFRDSQLCAGASGADCDGMQNGIYQVWPKALPSAQCTPPMAAPPVVVSPLQTLMVLSVRVFLTSKCLPLLTHL